MSGLCDGVAEATVVLGRLAAVVASLHGLPVAARPEQSLIAKVRDAVVDAVCELVAAAAAKPVLRQR
jgi:hypothetical protein